ncbi:CBS domain-containing protein CBSCBSPB2 [Hondaea fermentalgiana]|uniref:CBS domain-containing protein CBSCBSPB2 n=1 Tax=Hondaea fermentalgiana TaxID=2315210 RepID=A0A2R5G1B2_9STRA|nr:CBS domain-containing protein CBSCBSPB2 [Hondaea fermentalgiana]|eukprot:GBG24079.1 CBS domain-containing protein CBSCBSPB2 [Hondaea fermentalgiana]
MLATTSSCGIKAVATSRHAQGCVVDIFVVDIFFVDIFAAQNNLLSTLERFDSMQADSATDGSQAENHESGVNGNGSVRLSKSSGTSVGGSSLTTSTPRKSSRVRRRPKQKSATPVSRLLRHHKQRHPVIVSEETSVQETSAKLVAKRQSAALVIRKTEDGTETLAGICSEVDICRRLVGAGLPAESTPVRDIMTKDPLCVDPDEDFSVVLQIMVKHRFRHLPVVREPRASGREETMDTTVSNGAGPSDDAEVQASNTAGICGLVDITQCLYDAIHKIERMEANQAEFFEAVQKAQMSASGDLVDPEEAEALAQRTLQALMASISPSVGTVVQRKSLLKLDVSSTVVDAALAMKEARMTAVLVFEGLGVTSLPYSHKELDLESHQKFVGILTSKDVMTRVVGKGLDPSIAKVGEVMTGNPDTVRKDSRVLDALHIMQTERYLHLPVVDGGVAAGAADVASPGAGTEASANGAGNHGDASTNGEAEPMRVCGILSVLDCAVHTFASSSGKAAQVLSSAPTRKSSTVYYPTPVHGSGSSHPTDSLPSAPMYSHQQWRDPDSISAFSEVRSVRKSAVDPVEVLEGATEAQDLGRPPLHRSRLDVSDLDLDPENGSAAGSRRVPALGATTGSAYASSRTLLAGDNLVIKVKDLANGKVYRLSDKSISSLEDLLAQLERASGQDADEMQLVYLDEDKDRVQLANNLALDEARALAKQQGWKKIDVFILTRSVEQEYTVKVKDPVVLAAGILVAGLAVKRVLDLRKTTPTTRHERKTDQEELELARDEHAVKGLAELRKQLRPSPNDLSVLFAPHLAYACTLVPNKPLRPLPFSHAKPWNENVQLESHRDEPSMQRVGCKSIDGADRDCREIGYEWNGANYLLKMISDVGMLDQLNITKASKFARNPLLLSHNLDELAKLINVNVLEFETASIWRFLDRPSTYEVRQYTAAIWILREEAHYERRQAPRMLEAMRNRVLPPDPAIVEAKCLQEAANKEMAVGGCWKYGGKPISSAAAVASPHARARSKVTFEKRIRILENVYKENCEAQVQKREIAATQMQKIVRARLARRSIIHEENRKYVAVELQRFWRGGLARADFAKRREQQADAMDLAPVMKTLNRQENAALRIQCLWHNIVPDDSSESGANFCEQSTWCKAGTGKEVRHGRRNWRENLRAGAQNIRARALERLEARIAKYAARLDELNVTVSFAPMRAMLKVKARYEQMLVITKHLSARELADAIDDATDELDAVEDRIEFIENLVRTAIKARDDFIIATRVTDAQEYVLCRSPTEFEAFNKAYLAAQRREQTLAEMQRKAEVAEARWRLMIIETEWKHRVRVETLERASSETVSQLHKRSARAGAAQIALHIRTKGLAAAAERRAEVKRSVRIAEQLAGRISAMAEEDAYAEAHRAYLAASPLAMRAARKHFDAFDTEESLHPGEITPEDFQKLAFDLGVVVPMARIRDFVDRVDLNGNNLIDWDEFARWYFCCSEADKLRFQFRRMGTRAGASHLFQAGGLSTKLRVDQASRKAKRLVRATTSHSLLLTSRKSSRKTPRKLLPK